MLRGKRTGYVPLFEEVRYAYVWGSDYERRKGYDLEATKALILEFYNSSVDVQNLHKSFYYTGDFEEQLKHRVQRKRRASFSDSSTVRCEYASSVFSCSVISGTRCRTNQKKCYIKNLSKLLPSFVGPPTPFVYEGSP